MTTTEMMEVACYACGSNTFRERFPGNYTSVPLTSEHIAARKGAINKEFSYRWVECRHCSLVYANPVYRPETLRALYSASHQSEYPAEEKHLALTYKRYVYRYKTFLGKQELAIDVGAGNGFFLPILQEMGYQQARGYEPSAAACQRASRAVRPHLVCAEFNASSEHPASVDCITCFQTLEHIPSPQLLIRDFAHALRPRGIFYGVAHDVHSWGVRLFGRHHPIINAGHVALFNARTLRILCEQYFDIIDIFSIANTYSLSYWASLFPFPQPIKGTTRETSSLTVPVVKSRKR